MIVAVKPKEDVDENVTKNVTTATETYDCTLQPVSSDPSPKNVFPPRLLTSTNLNAPSFSTWCTFRNRIRCLMMLVR